MVEDHHIVIDDRVIAECADVMEIVDPMWWTINFYSDPETFAASGEIFTSEQRYLHAMIWYMSEVHNGGHSQFYSNSTGMVWQTALAGFEHFGLPQFQAILQESVSRFGESPPSLDRDAREDALDLIEDAGVHFDDLDKRLWEMAKNEAVLDRIMDFVKRHPSMFHFNGIVRH